LADHLAAGAVRIENLIEKTIEGAPDAKDPLSAVGAFVGLGQKFRGQQRAQELIQMEQALLAEVSDALAHGAQACAPGKEVRRMH
jgi:hypothetical protein